MTPGFVAEGFRRHGITYKYAERATSATYLELLPLVNAGAVVLLDEPHLLRELRGLERRRGTAGRDRVDHRPGAHDDRAVALAGALVAASARPRGGYGLLFVGAGEPGELAELEAENERLERELGLRE